MERVQRARISVRTSTQAKGMILILMLLFLGSFCWVIATEENDSLDLIEFSNYLGGSDDESMGVSFAFGDVAVDSKGVSQ